MEERTLTFGVSGKLILNDLVLYDRETGTLWGQLLGQGVKGPLRGAKLTALPAVQTKWSLWRQQHPDTLVLDKGGRYQSDRYAGYYRSGDAGVLGASNSDPRLPTKEVVLGLVLGARAKAYPFSALERQPVVNDALGGQQVVVVFDRGAQTGLAFNRTVAGRALTFEPAEADASPPTIRDRETGTLWSGLSGVALSGELAGEALQPLVATYAFWFGWRDFYTQTEVYGLEQGQRTP